MEAVVLASKHQPDPLGLVAGLQELEAEAEAM